MTRSVSANNASGEKINLLGVPQKELGAFFTARGEKAFRAVQLMKWMHHEMVSDFQQMTNISKALRDSLAQCAEVKPLDVAIDQRSADGTRKWLLRLADGNCIETVFIPEPDRGTLCVSSQVGCALDCSFCSTARQGFNRNLSAAEIVSQVWLAKKLLEEEKKPGRKVTNVVLMGMGEPLLNFDNMVKAIDIMMDDLGYGLSKRRVTVSTAGVVPAMDRLGQIMDMRLAVSLHATCDEVRDKLVPLNQKYPLAELMLACKRFLAHQSAKSVITFEYVMLDGINDSDEDARQLIRLLQGIASKINLIPFNPFAGAGYQCSPQHRIDRFRDILKKAGLTTVTRRTRGEDIDAACGQLVGKIQDRSRRERRFGQLGYG